MQTASASDCTCRSGCFTLSDLPRDKRVTDATAPALTKETEPLAGCDKLTAPLSQASRTLGIAGPPLATAGIDIGMGVPLASRSTLSAETRPFLKGDILTARPSAGAERGIRGRSGTGRLPPRVVAITRKCDRAWSFAGAAPVPIPSTRAPSTHGMARVAAAGSESLSESAALRGLGARRRTPTSTSAWPWLAAAGMRLSDAARSLVPARAPQFARLGIRATVESPLDALHDTALVRLGLGDAFDEAAECGCSEGASCECKDKAPCGCSGKSLESFQAGELGAARPAASAIAGLGLGAGPRVVRRRTEKRPPLLGTSKGYKAGRAGKFTALASGSMPEVFGELPKTVINPARSHSRRAPLCGNSAYKAGRIGTFVTLKGDSTPEEFRRTLINPANLQSAQPPPLGNSAGYRAGRAGKFTTLAGASMLEQFGTRPRTLINSANLQPPLLGNSGGYNAASAGKFSTLASGSTPEQFGSLQRTLINPANLQPRQPPLLDNSAGYKAGRAGKFTTLADGSTPEQFRSLQRTLINPANLQPRQPPLLGNSAGYKAGRAGKFTTLAGGSTPEFEVLRTGIGPVSAASIWGPIPFLGGPGPSGSEVFDEILLAPFSAGPPLNVSVHPDDLEMGSPSMSSNPAAPVVVRRDNPRVLADVDLGYALPLIPETAQGIGFDANYGGFMLPPLLQVAEFPSNVTDVDVLGKYAVSASVAPQLPPVGVFGPSSTVVTTSTATGKLVPGNLYRYVGYHMHFPTSSHAGGAWIKLSDEVLVVPVIITTHGEIGPPDLLLDQLRAMFDFTPGTMLAPVKYQPPPYSGESRQDFGALEIPPDDIWNQCKIQFQVIAAFHFDEIRIESRTTGDNCLPGGQARELVRAALTGQFGAELANQIVDDVDPLIVQYCYQGLLAGGQAGFLGKFASINLARQEGAITAHELGHPLGLDDGSGGLMTDSEGSTELLPTQCGVAQGVASAFAARYRAFLERTGRIGLIEFLPRALFASSDVEELLNRPRFIPTCCNLQGLPTRITPEECALLGGTEVAFTECDRVCCTLDGATAHTMPRVDCHGDPSGIVLDSNQCDSICCDGRESIFRYDCLQRGGAPMDLVGSPCVGFAGGIGPCETCGTPPNECGPAKYCSNGCCLPTIM